MKPVAVFVFVFVFVLFPMIGMAQSKEFPKCYFENSVDYGLIPLAVRFSGNLTPFATSEWDFDDGATSAERNPAHTFEEQCNCYVELTVTKKRNGNSNSCARIVMALLVLPDFRMNRINGRAPLEVVFTNTTSVSDGVVLDYNAFPPEWDFGDGSEISTEENPTHIYTERGEYDVSLTIRYDGWYYTRIKMGVIRVRGIARLASDEAEEEKITVVSPDDNSKTIMLHK